MKETYLLFLRDRSRELEDRIDASGSIKCWTSPLVELGRAPSIAESATCGLVIPADLRELLTYVVVKCDFDPKVFALEDVRRAVENVAIALQIVKPTRNFLEYWMLLDASGNVKLVGLRFACCHVQSLIHI